MTTVTWEQVHAGDTVRGADQRVWTVVGRERSRTWLGSGVTEIPFLFRLGDREVRARRAAHEPAPVVERADHAAAATAFAALTAAEFEPHLMEETLSTATADPFSAPAAKAGATEDVKHDRFGRYMLPDPETGKERAWTRATTLARTLADEYHLTQWKLRQVARGMALRPDLIAAAAAADPDDKATLDSIAKQAMERAGAGAGANLGTALHSFAHRRDLGEAPKGMSVPPPLDRDLVEYGETVDRHRLKVLPELAERVVVLPELGVAGRLDRIVAQPAGVTHSEPLAILDLKTAKDPSYSWLDIAIQLALYARAPLMWNPARSEYEPMPTVDLNRALVLHLPVGKAHGQLYGINILKGWQHVQTAMTVREARSEAKSLAWLIEPEPTDLALHRVRNAANQQELAQLWDQLHPKGLWTEEVNAAATALMTELAASTAA